MITFRGKPRISKFITSSLTSDLHGPCCYAVAILGPDDESVAEFVDPGLAAFVCDMLNDGKALDQILAHYEESDDNYWIDLDGLDIDDDDGGPDGFN